MKIELGKKYRTRGGWIGLVRMSGFRGWGVDHGDSDIRITPHDKDGKCLNGKTEYDLIAPWDEPSEKPTQDLDAIRRQYACAALTGLLAHHGGSVSPLGSEAPDHTAEVVKMYVDAMMAVENDKNA